MTSDSAAKSIDLAEETPFALAGAEAGVRWNHLPPKVRADIRQRVKAVRA